MIEPNPTNEMSELEKIFNRYATEEDVEFNDPCMSYSCFKQALTEVFEKIRVTDEEIEAKPEGAFLYAEELNAFKITAKWSRDLQRQKLEKLLK